jgi:hypothetical protein
MGSAALHVPLCVPVLILQEYTPDSGWSYRDLEQVNYTLPLIVPEKDQSRSLSVHPAHPFDFTFSRAGHRLK